MRKRFGAERASRLARGRAPMRSYARDIVMAEARLDEIEVRQGLRAARDAMGCDLGRRCAIERSPCRSLELFDEGLLPDER